MKTKIATNIEQSKRLLKAGLDPGSADMQWKYSECDDRYFLNVAYEDSQLFADFPAWSLSRLIDISRSCRYGDNSEELIESRVDFICFLISCGDIDEKYLKK